MKQQASGVHTDSVVVAVPITVQPEVITTSRAAHNAQNFSDGFREPPRSAAPQNYGHAGQNAVAPPYGAEPGGIWKVEKFCGGISCIICLMGFVCVCCCPCDGKPSFSGSHMFFLYGGDEYPPYLFPLCLSRTPDVHFSVWQKTYYERAQQVSLLLLL